MKKLALALWGVLAITACKQKQSNQLNGNPSPQTRQLVTLNGVDSTTAKAMTDTFAKYKDIDKTPYPTSVWFSRETIHSIDSLLHAEIKNQKNADPTRKDTTDGIRMYFACDPSITTPPLKTSILLVSTFDSLKYPAGKSPHRDYYVHNASFLSSPIGSVSNDKNVKGASLFDDNFICPAETKNCALSAEHQVTCEQAHGWVKNHCYGKIAINTKSEWFDLKLIDSLNKEIHNPQNNPDGLRIYFAYEDKDRDGKSLNRHVFVLVTTSVPQTDYFGCFYIFTPSHWAGDNGELCPDNCD